ncbi:Asp23/Gls24 family envelope stress response protein [Actinoplanes sp. NPDC020271]|uniref:Asp23/Gls24 family envelope stress response protein n=1 Tax=Actinoplanes sp. NPDC020271 TaxID=3363896 RepID=UPI0037A9E58E
MTSTLTSTEPTTPTTPARSTATAAVLPRQSRLSTTDGKIVIAENVVQKIAGIACREVSGVHAMGGGSTRAFGAIRERIPGSNGPNVAQGVGVEVGETEAAIDLDIVVQYGISIADLGRSIQRNVKTSIERMTGLNVVEVNVSVDDVHMPEAPEDRPESRVS